MKSVGVISALLWAVLNQLVQAEPMTYIVVEDTTSRVISEFRFDSVDAQRTKAWNPESSEPKVPLTKLIAIARSRAVAEAKPRSLEVDELAKLEWRYWHFGWSVSIGFMVRRSEPLPSQSDAPNIVIHMLSDGSPLTYVTIPMTPTELKGHGLSSDPTSDDTKRSVDPFKGTN